MFLPGSQSLYSAFLARQSDKMKRLNIARFIIYTLPYVERELKYWQNFAHQSPDPNLQEQALKSIKLKRFHAQGGSIYACWYPYWDTVLTPLIVAVQTISDYLDNLCDRMQFTDPDAFRVLHLAFLDALNPDAPLKDYYRLYPNKNDGGYLAQLVVHSQQQVRLLPGFPVIRDLLSYLASLYCDLQVYKHMDLANRESTLKAWAEKNGSKFPTIAWWEFSAATGSTLAIFALLAAATQPQLTSREADQIFQSYFPWICGLHILLDYYIDQYEDRVGGDLNFVFYYSDPTSVPQRLGYFVRQAIEQAQNLPDPEFHTTIVKGLPALYLSDPKVKQQGLDSAARYLITQAGSGTHKLYRLCRALRCLRAV